MTTVASTKETVAMRTTVLFALCMVASIALGCRESRLVMAPNATPTAVAMAIGPDGKAAKEVQFDSTGEDVEVTLDGSGSTDKDGKVVTYRWLSGTAVPPDGGMGNLSHDNVNAGGRLVPPGEKPEWPDDVKMPTVKLPVGVWVFTLWVIDDKGGVSDPSTVKVKVGAAVDPIVQACIDNVYSAVPMACRACVCGLNETCRTAVQMDKCDMNCWGLINCIGAMCPNFATMAMMMDFSCVTTNCMPYLSGSTGAQGAGMCVTMCLNDCAGMGGGTPDAGH